MNESNQLELRPDQPAGLMEQQTPSKALPVKRLLIFLVKFWWIPLITLGIGLGAGVGYVLWKPATFVSKARMWETVKLNLPEGSLFTENVQNFLGTQTELLQSGALRELALTRLRNISTNTVIPIGNNNQPLPVDINVAGSAKSSLFTLEARGSDPVYIQNYLDALMGVYLDYKRNIRKEVSGGTLASITEQVQVTERDLKDQQDIFMAFQETNNLAILQQEGAIAGSYLATLQTKLSDLQLEERLLRAMAIDQDANKGGTTNAGTGGELANVLTDSTTIAGQPSPGQTAFRELELLKIQRAQLSQQLRPKHPKIVKLDADIEQAEKLLDIFRSQNREQLTESRKATLLKIDNIEDSIKNWEGKVVQANSRIAEAERLKLNVQRVQNQYDRLVILLQNVGISRNIDQENLAILEPASPAQRSFVTEIRVLAIAVFGGLGTGLGLILLAAFRDDRFTSLNELSEKLGEIVVGQVPEVYNLLPDATVPLLENNDQRHAYAESFRSLRSAILFMTAEAERPQVVLVTSALPHEGKSTVAANLARVLALGGARVVLIDGDLRKGALHKLMGLQSEPGLVELLHKPGDLQKLIQTNSHPNLEFIARGRFTENAGDLFLEPAFDEIIAQLRQRFDYVIIDSSPVFAADDASTIATKVDGTLFVVRSRYSSPLPVREALDLLYQRRARVLGVIFNQADSSDRSYYYYKDAEYYPAEKAA